MWLFLFSQLYVVIRLIAFERVKMSTLVLLLSFTVLLCFGATIGLLQGTTLSLIGKDVSPLLYCFILCFVEMTMRTEESLFLVIRIIKICSNNLIGSFRGDRNHGLYGGDQHQSVASVFVKRLCAKQLFHSGLQWPILLHRLTIYSGWPDLFRFQPELASKTSFLCGNTRSLSDSISWVCFEPYGGCVSAECDWKRRLGAKAAILHRAGRCGVHATNPPVLRFGDVKTGLG